MRVDLPEPSLSAATTKEYFEEIKNQQIIKKK